MVAISPKQSQFNQQLAQAKKVHIAGNLEQAQKLYEKLLRKTPGSQVILSLLGGLLLQREQWDKALEKLKRANAKNHQDADLPYNLGLAHFHLNQFEQAVAAFQQSTTMNPEHDRAYYMMARAYLGWDSHVYREQAFKAYLKDIDITQRVDSYVMVADILHEQGRYEDARGIAKKALEIDKTNEMALWVIAKTMISENYSKAKVDIAIAEPIVKIGNLLVQLYPNSWRGHHILAESLTMIGEDALAVQHYEKLNKLNSRMAVTRTTAGVLMLKQGRLKEGWEEISYRKHHGAELYGMNLGVLEQCKAPVWQGEIEAGKHILIASEQGIGDQMLHTQMTKDLLDAGMHVYMTCTAKILDIMSRSIPQIQFFSSKDAIPEEVLAKIDYKAELLDLGKHLRDDISKFKDHFYYLQPQPDLVEHFKTRYQQFGDKLKVGISWKSVSKSVGKLKSTELIQWREILTVPGVQFINIQYGESEADIQQVRDELGVDVYVDEFDPFQDIEKAVAQIAALDLVISVSNASVHMAGQLQIPTWVLLNFRTLWHWFYDETKTVWYDSVQLYRQAQLQGWEPVFTRVASDLEQYVSAIEKASDA